MLRSVRPALADIAAIIAVWAGFLGLLWLLGQLGFGTGLALWPMGEDRNWIDMLQRGPGSGAANLLWALDGRNPLSPWWYIALRPIILGYDAGLPFIRYVVGLALALASYGLVIIVAGRSSRAFALAAGMVIAVFMANAYFDQIFWNFQGALACSILSVGAFALFLQGGRRDYRWYGASLVLWFLALATYTIQCGAILAIAYLSFFERDTGARERASGTLIGTLWRRAIATVSDTVPFGLLFLMFLLIWRTAGPPPGAFALEPSLSNTLRSIAQGLWHDDSQLMLLLLAKAPHRIAYLVVAAGSALVVCGLLVWRSAGRGPSAPIAPRRLLDVLAVVLCLALPTIAVETAGSQWQPGSRWRMIYQFTTPLFYLGIAALLVASLGASYRKPAWGAAVAALFGVALVVSLVHNSKQTNFSRAERTVRDAMLEAAAVDAVGGMKQPLRFLMLLDSSFAWFSVDALSPVYARTWFGQNDISFRLAPSPHYADLLGDRPPVRFLPDGVEWGPANVPLVPYEHVRVLALRDGRAERLATVTAQDLDGFLVDWQRDAPVHLPVLATPCPLTWTADRPALMTGLDAAETDAQGPFRWMVAQNARIILPATCAAPSRLRIVVAQALSERNLADLSVAVDGRTLSLARRLEDGNHVYEAEMPATSPAKPLQLDLALRELDTLAGAPRAVGVAIRSITIGP